MKNGCFHQDYLPFVRIHNYVARKRLSVRNVPPSIFEPTAAKSLNLLPWFRDAEVAVQNFFIQEAQIVKFPAGSAVQKVAGNYDGIYVVGMGTLLVKGEAGLIRCGCGGVLAIWVCVRVCVCVCLCVCACVCALLDACGILVYGAHGISIVTRGIIFAACTSISTKFPTVSLSFCLSTHKMHY